MVFIREIHDNAHDAIAHIEYSLQVFPLASRLDYYSNSGKTSLWLLSTSPALEKP